MWFRNCSLCCYFNTFVVVLLFKILQALLNLYCSHSEMSKTVEGNTCMDCLVAMSVVGTNMLVLLIAPSFCYSNTFCESLRLFCVGAVKGEKNLCGFVSLQFGTHWVEKIKFVHFCINYNNIFLLCAVLASCGQWLIGSIM